jgi:hypothetical protein
MSNQLLLLFGVAIFASGIGAYLNPHFFRRTIGNYTDNPAIIYINGFLNLAVGFYLVSNHNIWVKDWLVILTIIGWVATVRGLWILLAPEHYLKTFKSFWLGHGHIKGESIIMIILGGAMIYLSIM